LVIISSFTFGNSFRNLHSRILDFVPFPINRPKTGLNVVNFVNDLLLENGFTAEECLNVSVVTDEASNMNEFGNFLI